MTESDTIFALATPTARSPQALVRIAGPLVKDVAQRLCGSPLKRGSTSCSIRLPLGDVSAAIWILPAPHTLTGQHTLELRVPGNPAIVRHLEDLLTALGCRPAEAGEFTRRALEAGKLDLHRAEGVLQLINATSDAARRQALADLSGDTAAAISGLGERLRALCARFEMSFDFSEEEHAEANEDALLNDLRALTADLRVIVGDNNPAPRRDLPVIALFGPPNAGKSTLFNALLGKPRALVSELPGTTRDPVEAEIVIGRHSGVLVDVSGVGSADADEGRFAEFARERAAHSDILLVLEAPGGNQVAAEFDLLRKRDESVQDRAIWVQTMNDVAPGPLRNSLGVDSISVSALTGNGLDELRQKLTERLDQLASGQSTSLLRVRAREALAALEPAESENLPLEVIASDVRRALKLIDESLLAEAPGEVLDLIFSRFCIGK